tara:strand:+ start:5408 stop:6259 length:852 start_codon:yes stop_codon:yes gene_type:complete
VNLSHGLRRTQTILDRIVQVRSQKLACDKKIRSENQLLDQIKNTLEPCDFANVLLNGTYLTPKDSRIHLIAEIKRASPSKGDLNLSLDAPKQASQYCSAGVAAISILTEPDFFKGSIEDLSNVRQVIPDKHDRPGLLRKEFIWDSYQIIEARAFGADSLLLIVMLLEPLLLKELIQISRSIGMEPLVEIHDETELEIAINAGARIIGINNRDLRNFKEDLTIAERLIPLIPPNHIIVAESAIREFNDVERMIIAGADAILVGEALVKKELSTKIVQTFMGIEV